MFGQIIDEINGVRGVIKQDPDIMSHPFNMFADTIALIDGSKNHWQIR
jgi:hypothetical protein